METLQDVSIEGCTPACVCLAQLERQEAQMDALVMIPIYARADTWTFDESSIMVQEKSLF
eukprot:737643-Pelagomonas_calceolata.AAC.2